MRIRDIFSGLYFYLTFSTLLFVFSIYVGLTYYVFSPTGTIVIEPFKSLIELFRKLSPFQRILFVFFNNSVKGVLNIILGPLLGIYPLVFVVFNGFILGYTFALAASKTSLLIALLSVLPHGIIEIPAMIICNALGFKLAYTAIKSIMKRNGLKREFKRGIKIFVYLVIPMLFIAAIIEVLITPILIGVTI